LKLFSDNAVWINRVDYWYWNHNPGSNIERNSSLIIYWNTKSSWTITALNPYLSQANCPKLLVFMCYRSDSNHVGKLLEMFMTVVLDSITLFSFIQIEIFFGQFWFKPNLLGYMVGPKSFTDATTLV
jgi:hypothetical protein